jgi:5-methylcytosine-specific restriction endonuclease McrA
MSSKLRYGKCEICLKDFKSYNIGQLTCSRKCGSILHAQKQRGADVECKCLTCGKSFKVRPYYAKNGRGKYCSMQCSASREKTYDKNLLLDLWGKGRSVCSISRIMNISEAPIANFLKSQGIYEVRKSKGAEHYMWNGGISFDYRLFALNHYGKKCRKCNYDKYEQILHVHHIDLDRTNHDIKNLDVLCVRCHWEEHLVTQTGPFSNLKNFMIYGDDYAIS